MAKVPLGPGFRFSPTEVELVMYYLKRKVMGRMFFEAIYEIELYKFEPSDLAGLSCLRGKDREWFLFCSPNRKYATGQRTKRATPNGYWKTTGRDKPIHYNSRVVGKKKTLVFHTGKAPGGARTDWVMHEFRLEDKELADINVSQDAFVLCKIFKKSGLGPKNGEQYGEFKEEDWEDDDNDDDEANASSLPLALPIASSCGLDSGQNLSTSMSITTAELDSRESLLKTLPKQSKDCVSSEQNLSLIEIANLKKLVLEDSDVSGVHEKVDSIVPDRNTVGDADGHVILEESGNVISNDDVAHGQIRPGFVGERSYLELNDLQDKMEVQEPFLELEDLLYPIGADGSKCMSLDFLLAHHLGRDLPGHEAPNSILDNLEGWDTFGPLSSLPFNAGEMGNQSDDRRPISPTTFERAKSGNTFELQIHLQCGSSSNHQCRFGSLPACPASAVEGRPSSIKWESYNGIVTCFMQELLMSRMRWLLADPSARTLAGAIC